MLIINLLRSEGGHCLSFPFVLCHKQQEKLHIVRVYNYVSFHCYAGEHLIEDGSSMVQSTVI